MTKPLTGYSLAVLGEQARIGDVTSAITRYSTAVAVLALMACGCVTSNSNPPLTAAQQAELATLKGQLADRTRSDQTKLEAAELLLSRSYPQAVDALNACLGDCDNPAGQLAVAQAIARHRHANRAFVAQLTELLKQAGPAPALAAGRALTRYRDPGITAGMLAMARDSRLPARRRATVIRSLGVSIDRQTVDTMVALLGDRQGLVRRAAAASLAEITGIRTFGADRAKWQRWWTGNKAKKRDEWLADLAERLGKTVSSLQAENASLRERLAGASKDLYNSAGQGQQDAMLLTFLGDPVADVRLVGTFLVSRRLSANQPLPEGVRKAVGVLLDDSDPRCRQAAAVLFADLGDGDRSARLLARLASEPDQSVRRGLLVAIGKLKNAEALPTIVAEVKSSDDGIAAAAAEALGRIIGANPLTADARVPVSTALIARYKKAAHGPDSAKLRESLLTAMGSVGGSDMVGVIKGALGDGAAMVRLAAVGALAKIGQSGTAKLLEPLVADPDRGVRQAVISALGTLGGQDQLSTIISRTWPDTEPDPAVRDKAWEVVMDILARSDTKVIIRVADSLAGRADAADQRIEILQMLVAAESKTGAVPAAKAKRKLGLALMSSGRPAEAGPLLAEAWQVYQHGDNPEAPTVWKQWVAALLAADDPSVVGVMAHQDNDELFAAAMAELNARLVKLQKQHKSTEIILLIKAVNKGLSSRLGAAPKKALGAMLAAAVNAQRTRSRQETAGLLAQLQSAKGDARQEVLARLTAMGPRAVRPLLAELKKTLSAKPPNPARQADILMALGQVAPDFKGYDPTETKDRKIKLIDNYLKSLP